MKTRVQLHKENFESLKMAESPEHTGADDEEAIACTVPDTDVEVSDGVQTFK